MNGLSDGMAKVLEVLGARILSLENSESWARRDAETARKDRDASYTRNHELSVEVADLKKQLAEANEKIHEYEEAVIIDKDGKLVKFKDLFEIEIPGEFEQEIRASLDRGKAPGKATE